MQTKNAVVSRLRFFDDIRFLEYLLQLRNYYNIISYKIRLNWRIVRSKNLKGEIYVKSKNTGLSGANVEGVAELAYFMQYGDELTSGAIMVDIEVDHFSGYEYCLAIMLLAANDIVIDRTKEKAVPAMVPG